MGNSVGLVTDEIVETIRRVRVDEAVPNPLTCPYALVDVCDNIERRFYSILLYMTGVKSL